MKPPTYQPEIIEEQARRILQKAASLPISYAFLGALIAFLFGLLVIFLMSFFPGNSSLAPYLLQFFMIAVGGSGGYVYGKEKAFEIRLKAQELLMQLQIEKNTRRRDQPTFDAKNQV